MLKDSNTEYIGRKPTMSYVLTVITSFMQALRARGRAIATAVDLLKYARKENVKWLTEVILYAPKKVI